MTQTQLNVAQPRPEISDEEIRRQAILDLMPELLSYCDDKPDDQEAIEQIMEQMLDATDSHDVDGYQLAKRLDDDHYWEASSELVDICESYWFKAHNALTDAVKRWVETTKPVAPFALNDKVQLQRYPTDKVWHDATIVEIRADTAEYIVNAPSLGHGLSGPHKTGTTGQILPFESKQIRAPQCPATPTPEPTSPTA